MNQTTNYGLNQWGASDRVQREDFNADNAAVDAALKANADAAAAALAAAQSAASSGAKLETGSYVGSGTYGSANPRTLTFSFQPKLVIIAPDTGGTDLAPAQLAAFFQGQRYAQPYLALDSPRADYIAVLTWSGNSVSWYCSSFYGALNYSGKTYYYAAIG